MTAQHEKMHDAYHDLFNKWRVHLVDAAYREHMDWFVMWERFIVNGLSPAHIPTKEEREKHGLFDAPIYARERTWTMNDAKRLDAFLENYFSENPCMTEEEQQAEFKRRNPGWVPPGPSMNDTSPAAKRFWKEHPTHEKLIAHPETRHKVAAYQADRYDKKLAVIEATEDYNILHKMLFDLVNYKPRNRILAETIDVLEPESDAKEISVSGMKKLLKSEMENQRKQQCEYCARYLPDCNCQTIAKVVKNPGGGSTVYYDRDQ